MDLSSSSAFPGLRRVLAWASLGLIIALAGCVTPESRIRRNQGVFDALAPTDQALIREGKVALGFTPEMVRLAVGDPDQRWSRTDAAGTSEIWTYATYESALGLPLFRGYYHRYHEGYAFYDDRSYRRDARPHEYFRVSFVAGKVSEIQQEER